MANHIIFIHGLNPKPEESVLAERELRYISEGVGFSVPPQHFHLAYWADIMEHSPIAADQDDYNEDGDNFRPYSLKEEPTLWVKGKTRIAIKDTLEDLLSHYFRSADSERSVRRQKIMEHILSIVSNNPAKLAYNHFLNDLYKYLFNGKREAVLDRLRTQISSVPTSDSICLIAHSMGSIIALDLLLKETPAIKQFITIGSPLGLSVVQKQIGATGSTQAVQRRKDMSIQIGSWTNFYDPLDIVALDSDLKDDFPEQGIEDIKVRNEFVSKNGERNPHKSYGYLRTREVGEVVRAFMQQA